MDETLSIDYPTREAAEEALRMVLTEDEEGVEASVERHGEKWRLTLHRDDGEDGPWMVTSLETF